MPSTYAHYRMGFRSIENLTSDVQSIIRRNRQMYDLGLHGPDFLYFHNPIQQDRFYLLANEIHRNAGKDFFVPACRHLRFFPSEAATAYLYGVLAHFTLDSLCHPYINAEAEKGIVGHIEMETEFDRYLLELDGEKEPYLCDIVKHIPLKSRKRAEEIAGFYPGITPKDVLVSLSRYHWMIHFCTAPKGLRRNLLDRGVFSDAARQQMMTLTPNLRCAAQTPQIKSRYDRAEDLYPSMMDQLTAHLSCNAPLGEEFQAVFG